jgi:catechol 2,3-dioxygenase-like lactoylglutathione lyase family enzyme
VAFTVPVLADAVAFFVDHFGGELVYEDGPFCRIAMVRIGLHMNIELFEYDAPEQAPAPPRNSDIGGHHLAFYVDDIDLSYEYVKSIPGVEVMEGPNGVDERAPVAGQRWFYFRTPWGMQMELTTCSTGGFYEGLPGSRMAPPADRWR